MDSLLDYARETMQAWGVPGLAVGALRDGKVVLAEGLGVRRADAPDPVTPETVFRIGSVTKSMTATAVGLLVAEGKFGWDDRVVDLLPGFHLHDPYVSAETTVRDLLCHRTGVEDAPLLYTGSDLTPEGLIGKLPHLRQRASFRSGLVYNNMMFLAVGALVQLYGGRPFGIFLRERLFEPLGMTRTTVGGVGDEAREAAGHVRYAGEAVVLPHGCGDMEVLAPSSAVRSCLRDLLEWSRVGLQRGKVGGRQLVPAEIVHELHALHVPSRQARYLFPEAQFQGYALGMYTGDHRGVKIVPAPGRVAGGTVEVLLAPEARVGVVVLGNLDMTWVGNAVSFEVLDRLLGLDSRDWSAKMLKWCRGAAEAGARPAADHPASRPEPEYAGRYEHPLYGPLQVQHDGGLTLHYNREVRGALRHDAYDTFRLCNPDNPLLDHRGARATFRLDPLGEVEAVELAFPIPHKDREFDRVSFRRRA